MGTEDFLAVVAYCTFAEVYDPECSIFAPGGSAHEAVAATVGNKYDGDADGGGVRGARGGRSPMRPSFSRMPEKRQERLSRMRISILSLMHFSRSAAWASGSVRPRAVAVRWNRASCCQYRHVLQSLDRRNLRPGRRYHPNFTKCEIEKLSFGKKLKLNPKNDILVAEENA
jgi:hypothetical protein